MNLEKAQTLAIAAAPPLAGITMAKVNEVLGCVSLVVGIAFALWNWRRLARQSPEK